MQQRLQPHPVNISKLDLKKKAERPVGNNVIEMEEDTAEETGSELNEIRNMIKRVLLDIKKSNENIIIVRNQYS